MNAPEMSLLEARTHAEARLRASYELREAEALARHLLCELLGIKPHAFALRQNEALGGLQEAYEAALKRLEAGEPLQYIFGHAPFMDMLLAVSPAVLIPRPETEELAQWIIDEHAGKPLQWLLDIGTGSGALALALKRAFPKAAVVAMDISAGALDVAEQNAEKYGVPLYLAEVDVLQAPDSLHVDIDLIVSNPPYVPAYEQHALHRNVVEHEPHEALFVPDNDPLLFYKAIGARAAHWLAPGGWLYFELHVHYAQQVAAWFAAHEAFTGGQLKHDLQGKLRMFRARRA